MVALGRPFLARHGVESARLEAELLVAHSLGLERLELFLQLDRPVSPSEVSQARELLVRRARGEPVAYVTGVREFYGRPFGVGPGVLIPRPETELIVDRARDWSAGRSGGAPRVLDLGTGSGCLAITLALELEGSTVVATDVSADALGWAQSNAKALGATIEFRTGDGLEAVAGEQFDLVVMNPPYIDRAHTGDLAVHVRDHEPDEALYAPAGDPDHWALALVAAGPELLLPGGAILCELGFDQAERLRTALRETLGAHQFHADLAGIERVLEWAAREWAPTPAGS